jgi:D-alanyl-D-alanine carboxypeptidase
LVWGGLVVVLVAGGLAALIDRTAFSGGSENPSTLVQQTLDGLVAGPGRVTMGATAYVAGPRGVWTGSAGIAQPGEPMPPNARLRLESVGKLWTATLILRLVEEHKLALYDTVSHWLPGLLPYGNQVNVLELLSMTSGMVDTNDFQDRPAYYISRITNPVLRAHLVALARYIKTHPTYQIPTRLWIQMGAASPLLYPPGAVWHYSNIGYMIAGMIAQRAGGADLATLFRRLIIDPLHLTSARYDPAPTITGPHAHGYIIFPPWKPQDATAWTGGLAANGGIVSDAADEAHFLGDVIQGRILKPPELQELETDYANNYGLGIWTQQNGCTPGAQVFSHNGGGGGYMSTVQVSPDGRHVGVVLINGYEASTAAQNHAETLMIAAMQRLYCAN